ncbi:MAG TPA: ATP phosphoribosyltransferase regulatory subunit, partial [Pyrinomonadaceae bacterium]
RDAAALEEFLRALGRSGGTVERAGRLARLAGSGGLPAGARELLTNERSRAALDELESLCAVAETLGLGEGFSVDLADVSGLDYYTGLVFKIYVEGAGSRVGAGGRYDELTANFGRREPAVGFVLDLDTLTEILARRADRAEGAAATDAAAVEGADAAERFGAARRRRADGVRIRME